MTGLDPTHSTPGDSLADYRSDVKAFSVNEINDYLFRIQQLALYPETLEAALHAISAWMALLNGNLDQANREQVRYKRVARIAGRPAEETIPTPRLTTKKDTTL